MKSKLISTRNIKIAIIVGAVLLIASVLRLIDLDKVPASLYVDEASIGYNSYSLLQTGKDEYGKTFPVFIRSFATFQSPLYTYLTIIPVYLFDLNIYSTRIVSAISGVILVFLTYLFVKTITDPKKKIIAVFAATLVAISPWAVFQSRVAVEANLALMLCVLSLYLYRLSLEKIILFIPASIVLAVSAYSYHGQRILSFIFLFLILAIFYKIFVRHKKIVITGIVLFFIIQIPLLIVSSSQGSLRRFETQGYIQNEAFERFGGDYKNIPVVGRALYISRKFSAQYLSSYSPRSLFHEPENQTFRSMTNLSTFYIWMIIPFFLGINQLIKNRHDKTVIFLLLIIVFGPIPQAITGDPFYTLRMLPMLWGITILIAFGLLPIFQITKIKFLNILLFAGLITFSLFMLYSSYFILFKAERSYAFGYPYLILANRTEQLKDKKFVVDTGIYDAPYILLAFFKKQSPSEMQLQTSPEILNEYYDNLTFNKFRNIENVEVRSLDWSKDPCRDQIIVADIGTLSEPQAMEHKLSLFEEVKDLTGKTILWLYQTNPQLKDTCKSPN